MDHSREDEKHKAQKREITAWLKGQGHDRAWLAEQIHSTENTVNKWFSRGFPDYALAHIQRLMNPTGDMSAGLDVVFSAKEWNDIELASKLAGFATRREFFQAVLRKEAEQILKREKGVQAYIAGDDLPLVAEEEKAPKGGV